MSRETLLAVFFVMAGCASPPPPEGEGAADTRPEARALPIEPVAQGLLPGIDGHDPPREPEVRIFRDAAGLGRAFSDYLEAAQKGLGRRVLRGAGDRALLVYLGRREETGIQVQAIRARIDDEGALVVTVREEREAGDVLPQATFPFFVGRLELGETAPRKVKLRALDGRPLRWEVWVDGEPR